MLGNVSERKKGLLFINVIEERGLYNFSCCSLTTRDHTLVNTKHTWRRMHIAGSAKKKPDREVSQPTDERSSNKRNIRRKM